MQQFSIERGWISGQFPSLKMVDAKKANTFKLLEPVKYATSRLKRTGYTPVLVATQGFITDLASIPRFLPLSMHRNRVASPAIIHDMLYQAPTQYKGMTRKLADRIFLDAMIDNGVGRIRAHTYYMAVRTFGWRHYANP
jgi:hypothetical protein